MVCDAGEWRLDLDAIERGLERGAGSVLLCNPINPVGTILDRDQLSALANLVEHWRARHHR